MQVIDSACTPSLMALTAYSGSAGDCTGNAFLNGLQPSLPSAPGSTTCFNTSISSYKVQVDGYNGGDAISSVSLLQGACGDGTNNVVATTPTGVPVTKGACSMLKSATTTYGSFQWSDPLAFTAPAGVTIPEGSLSPIKCYKGNSSSTPTLQSAAMSDTNLCYSTDFVCQPGIPQSVIDDGICTAADVTARKVLKAWDSISGSTWAILIKQRLTNCTGTDAACALYTNFKPCNTDGCNKPTAGNGAGGLAVSVASALAIAAATLVLFNRAD